MHKHIKITLIWLMKQGIQLATVKHTHTHRMLQLRKFVCCCGLQIHSMFKINHHV
jgi:hypothetical protein